MKKLILKISGWILAILGGLFLLSYLIIAIRLVSSGGLSLLLFDISPWGILPWIGCLILGIWLVKKSSKIGQNREKVKVDLQEGKFRWRRFS